MIDDTLKTSDPLEPFLLLGKGARGAAAAQLIQEVTEAPNIFVFGDFLQLDGIKELKKHEVFNKHWKLLQVYAFGVYKDLKAKQDELPEISDLQVKKLRLLTIATLASSSKFVWYKTLQESLDLENLRNIEDLIIEAIYAGILKGKLNQKEQRLEVEFVIGRDFQPHMIDDIIKTLENWCTNCDNSMVTLDELCNLANSNKDMKAVYKKNTEQQIEQEKKILRLQDMQQDTVESTTQQQQQQQPNLVGTQKLKPMKATTVKASTSRTK